MNTTAHGSITNERLELILALSPAVIYTCRPDGDYGATFISENIKSHLGYEPSDFIEDSSFWARNIHPEDQSELFENLSKLFQTGEHVHEYRFRHKDGIYRWVRDELRLLTAQDGKPIEIIGSWTDISEHKGLVESLRKSQACLEEGQRIAHLGSWEWDIQSDIAHWSDEAFRIFGVDSQAISPCYATFLDVIHPEDRERVNAAVQRATKERASYNIDFRIVHPGGSLFYVNAQGQVTFSRDGEPVRMVGTILDITGRRQVESDLKEKKACLEHLAYYDSLTELPNRTLLMDRLAQAIGRGDRHNSQVALFFLDLDLFKKINDTLGHQSGDLILQNVALRLQSTLRREDTIARFGGDEFVIMVEGIPDTKQVAQIAQKILASLELPFSIGSQLCYISTSIGISLYTSRDDNAESLLKRADIAMYAVKKMGRNNFQFYSQEMDIRAHELLLLENDLRQALDTEQLVLHYQPQVDLSSGQIIGLEALVRWQHPDKGLVPPNDFIPLAEETGLIIPIGAWVLRTACSYARTLQEAGTPQLRMSVNISMRQFKAPNFPALVFQILNETGLEPQWLELEITESIAMEDIDETISQLTTLREKGVGVAIDDFGTGHSSLSHLKRIPITTLKIDRAFVRDVLTDPYDLAIIEAIQTLAKTLKLEVVAEGIETREQKQLLFRLGCTLGQGFLFSSPLPPDDILSLCQLEKPFKNLL
jgi:diguanylate cyclase (GGDEF)-like protein/PAS domain S-box-containing protein